MQYLGSTHAYTMLTTTLRLRLLLASCVMVPLLHAQNDSPAQVPTTRMEFVQMEHDFGWVLQDSENRYVFRFKNLSLEPLVIENAAGSCGCTVPDFSKDPIAPGAESEIEVEYKPGKQEGHQLKTITITANTVPSRTVLRIHAEVLTADPGEPSPPYVFEPMAPLPDPVFDPLGKLDPSDAEPVHEGPGTQVSFEVMEHDFGQVLQGSENPYVFKFKNTGDAPLLISNAQGSCGCTVPFYAKDPILPGEESEIHVVYKPGKQEGIQSKTVTFTANTVPKQTILRIRAEVLVVDSVAATELFIQNEEYQHDRETIETVNPGCFVLFPNPTSNELRLDLKEHIGRSADVRIHDTTGREMLRNSINNISSETSRLDVSSFPAGVYIATIQVEGGQPMSQCFVVDR